MGVRATNAAIKAVSQRVSSGSTLTPRAQLQTPIATGMFLPNISGNENFDKIATYIGTPTQNITYLGSCGGFNKITATAADCGLPFTVPAGTCEVNDVLMFIVQCYGTTPISSSPQITPSGGVPLVLTTFLQTGAEGMYVAFARTKVSDATGDTTSGNLFGHCVRATTASASEKTVNTTVSNWITGAMDIVLRIITSGSTFGGAYMSCWHIKGGTGVDPSTIMVDYSA